MAQHVRTKKKASKHKHAKDQVILIQRSIWGTKTSWQPQLKEKPGKFGVWQLTSLWVPTYLHTVSDVYDFSVLAVSTLRLLY